MAKQNNYRQIQDQGQKIMLQVKQHGTTPKVRGVTTFNPDDGDKASLWNVDISLNTDAADRPRKFYNIHAPWKF
jgi:hypothetical protein